MAKVYATGTQRRYIYANSLQGLEIEFYNFKNLEESSSVLLTSSHNSNINQATVSPILILHLYLIFLVTKKRMETAEIKILH